MAGRKLGISVNKEKSSVTGILRHRVYVSLKDEVSRLMTGTESSPLQTNMNLIIILKNKSKLH